MSKRRRILLALTGLAILGLVGAVGAWHYRTTRPDYRLARGREALRADDLETAESLVESLTLAGARDHARLLRAEIDVRLGRLTEAITELNGIEDRGPLYREAIALQGRCFLGLKLPSQAAGAFQYVLSQDPDQVEAHRGLAIIYFDQGAMTRSIHHLEQVVRLASTDGRPLLLMARIYKDQEQANQAAECYEAALERDLDPPLANEARRELAEVLVKRQQFARVLDLLDRSPPRTREARLKDASLRAECLIVTNRTEEARKVLDKALAEGTEGPAVVGLLTQRAKLHLDAGEIERAVTLLERAVRIDPHDYFTNYQLAQAYEAQNRSEDANRQRHRSEEIKAALTEMIQLNQEAMKNPWDPAVRERLAALAERLGKPDQAASWRRAARACAEATAAGAASR
jgi:tetratricopeptide (TPR) repeat protein